MNSKKIADKINQRKAKLPKIVAKLKKLKIKLPVLEAELDRAEKVAMKASDAARKLDNKYEDVLAEIESLEESLEQ